MVWASSQLILHHGKVPTASGIFRDLNLLKHVAFVVLPLPYKFSLIFIAPGQGHSVIPPSPVNSEGRTCLRLHGGNMALS